MSASTLAPLPAKPEAPGRTLSFDHAAVHADLDARSDAELDLLDFGVIGFDSAGMVRRYNTFESKAAGLLPERVLGNHLFTRVAPCMNNFMVAQRFEDAAAAGQPLDATIDYTLTLRMRPVKVALRLLSQPGAASGTRYVLVRRLA
jgi:photoactive yellow protein